MRVSGNVSTLTRWGFYGRLQLTVLPCTGFKPGLPGRSCALSWLHTWSGRLHFPPGFSFGVIRARGAFWGFVFFLLSSPPPPKTRLGNLGAPSSLSSVEWEEAAGGAAWGAQSDGQLLPLVQAVAGACQVKPGLFHL